MRHRISSLLLLMALEATSCSDTVSPTTDVSQAKKWFIGKWSLVAVSSMLPNPPVPNVQLFVSDNQVSVVQDGKQIDKVNYEISQTAYDLQLKTDAQPRKDNWYVRNPALRMSKNRMLLDAGMATDGPGFTFERVK